MSASERFEELRSYGANITDAAEETARSIKAELTGLRIGIFAVYSDDEDERPEPGGVNLQIVTDAAVAIVHVNADGKPFGATAAEGRNFHTQPLFSRAEAVAFLKRHGGVGADRGDQ